MQPSTCEVEAKEWKIAGIKYLKSAKLCTQLSNNGVANKNQPKSIKKVAKKNTESELLLSCIEGEREEGRARYEVRKCQGIENVVSETARFPTQPGFVFFFSFLFSEFLKSNDLASLNSLTMPRF